MTGSAAAPAAASPSASPSLPLRGRLFLATLVAGGAGALLLALYALLTDASALWGGLLSERIGAVLAGAPLASVPALPAALVPFALLLLALVVLAAAAQHLPATVGPGYKVTLAQAVYFADVLLLGPALAVVVVALSALVGQGALALRRDPVTRRPRRGLLGVAFNTAQAVLAIGLGGVVYVAGAEWLGSVAAAAVAGTPPGPLRAVVAALGATGPAGPAGLLAAAGAAGAIYLTNSGTVATIVAMQRGGRPWDVWRATQRNRFLETTGDFLIGLFFALALGREPWLLIPAGAGALVLHRSLVRRAELDRREAEATSMRELARRKDEFVGTVSHELRTPLTVVCGYAELLLARRTGLDATASRMLATLLNSATQLSRMVDDLLEFARVERGPLAVRPAWIDIGAVVSQATVAMEHQEGGERIRTSIASGLTAHADATRVAQAVTNLLSNALKYAPEGDVVVRAYRVSPAPEGATGTAGALPAGAAVRIEVQDSGPGILTSEQDRVWEAFYRGTGGAQNSSPRGTGIGLSVVKAATEAQGGRVGLWSAVGQGSRFWLDFPASPDPSPVTPPQMERPTGDAAAPAAVPAACSAA